MQINPVSQNMLNISGNPGKNSDTMDEPLRPMRTYKGHGMLEQYPANLTVAFVSAHESRHANKNRSEAGKEGEIPNQNISYKVQISPDGQVMATGGVTESRNADQGKNAEKSVEKHNPPDAAGAQAALSQVSYEKILKEFHLARKKESLERDLRENSNASSEGNSLNKPLVSEEASNASSDFTEKKSNGLSEKINKINIRREILQLEEEKKGISSSDQLKKDVENQAAASQEDAKTNIQTPSMALPEEEHTDLSNVAPSSYHTVKRDIPNAVLINGFGSAFELNNVLNASERFDPQWPTPKSASLEGKSLQQQFDALNTIGNRFNNLKIVSNEIGSAASFNTRQAASSFPEAVNAQTSVGSPVGSYRISVSNLALPHKLVSNEYSDPFTSLGLSGSFKINGYQVDVASSDSLNSLKDKINYGEDVNKNGQLDYAEDLNGNGGLDVYQIKPSVGSNHINIHEDADFSGTLNGTEDVNDNLALDGGSANLGVRADIKFNRLMVETIKTGNNIISADDTDGILMDLGFYYENNKGVIREAVQFDSTYSEQYNSSPTPARFSINGASLESPSNEVADVLPNTNLQLKQATSDPVTLNVNNAIDSTKGRIEKFAEEYNSSVSTINKFLEFERTLQGNAIVQNLRSQLVDHVNKPVDSLPQTMNSLQSAGLELQNTEKHAISSFAATVASDAVMSNSKAVSSYRAQGDSTIFSELREVGIKTQEDDALKVNSKKLSAALQDSPIDVAMVHASRGKGVADRLDSFLSDVLGKGGTLDMEKQRIRAYVTGFSSTNETYINVAREKRIASTAAATASAVNLRV